MVAAHQVTQLVPHHLHQLMTRGQTLEHLLPNGLGFDPFNKVLDDLDMDVGFKQRESHFLQRLSNVLLREHTLPT